MPIEAEIWASNLREKSDQQNNAILKDSKKPVAKQAFYKQTFSIFNE